MRYLTDDEHRLLALIGNNEVTMQNLVQDSRRNNLVPSMPFHNLLQASLRSGIIAGRRDGNYQYFRNNIGNCKDIAPDDYFRWIACYIHSPLRHR